MQIIYWNIAKAAILQALFMCLLQKWKTLEVQQLVEVVIKLITIVNYCNDHDSWVNIIINSMDRP